MTVELVRGLHADVLQAVPERAVPEQAPAERPPPSKTSSSPLGWRPGTCTPACTVLIWDRNLLSELR